MRYVITNETRDKYAAQLDVNGAYTLVSEPMKAKIFDKVKNANRVLGVNKHRFGNGFNVYRVDNIPELTRFAYDDGTDAIIEQGNDEHTFEGNEPVLDDNNIEQAFGTPDLPFGIVDKAREIAQDAELVKQRRQYLINELRLADLELTDIEHAAEFYELNAAQGYKLYRLLHDVRVRRRRAKDELQLLDTFLNSSVTRIDNVCKQAEGYSSRSYTPRVNKALFDV